MRRLLVRARGVCARREPGPKVISARFDGRTGRHHRHPARHAPPATVAPRHDHRRDHTSARSRPAQQAAERARVLRRQRDPVLRRCDSAGHLSHDRLQVHAKLSLGVEVGYEWLKYDNFDETANNYGWSIFGNYRIIPALYAHAEYQMINYEIFTSPTTSDRQWVPFLLVGGGFSKLVGKNAWAYVEVLFDVLNDNNSPYEDGEPIISVGVGVGF